MFDMGFPKEWSTMRKLLWIRRVLLSGASWVLRTITGSAPLTLTNAVSRAIHSLTQYGKCTQASTPTPDAPVDIVCNNGAIKCGGNKHDVYFVQYLNGYIKSSNRQISAYNGNSVVTYDCEVGKSYRCYDVGASGNAVSVNVGYSDTVPAIGTTYSADDFESIPCPGGYRTDGLIFTAKKRYVTFIFRYDGDSSKTPESMLSQMIFTEVGKEVGTLYTDGTPEVLTVSASGAETQTVTDVPMLLSVGDYEDEKDIISGGVTHRIGCHVFDGTETFSKSSAYGKAFLLNAAYAAWGADKTKAVLCTHFLGLPQKSSAQDDNTCFFNSTGHFYFRVTDNSDTDAFKAWLAEQYASGTPVIVFFVFAEETTEQTTPHRLHTSEGDNVVSVTSNVDPVELAVEYAGVAV